MSDLSVQVAWNYPECDHFSAPPIFFVHIFQLSIFFFHNQFAADFEPRCILSATTCCIFGLYASSACQAHHLCQVENEVLRNVKKIMQARKHWRTMLARGWTMPEVNADIGLIGWQEWKALGKLWMGGAPYIYVGAGRTQGLLTHPLFNSSLFVSATSVSSIISFFLRPEDLPSWHALFRFRNRHRILSGRGFISYNIFEIHFF